MTLPDQTPEHLRAGAVLWSLRASLAMLHDRDAAEARAIADERAAAADPLQSPRWGTRQALGGHSDPTSEALLVLHGPSRDNRYTALVDEVTGQLAEVARHLPPAGHDPLDRIEAALPALSEIGAGRTWEILDKVDGRIRRLLKEPADRRYVPKACCLWCNAVSLMVREAPPQPLRVVECTICARAWPWAVVFGKVDA
jgi:hypothetical protein